MMDSTDMNLRKLQEKVKDCLLQSMGSQRVKHNIENEQQHFQGILYYYFEKTDKLFQNTPFALWYLSC